MPSLWRCGPLWRAQGQDEPDWALQVLRLPEAFYGQGWDDLRRLAHSASRLADGDPAYLFFEERHEREPASSHLGNYAQVRMVPRSQNSRGDAGWQACAYGRRGQIR